MTAANNANVNAFMPTASNIRTARIRVGKSAKAVATELGLNDAWYRDLETNDDELVSTLTLFQAMQLASLLKVRLHELVDEAAPEKRISLMELPGLVSAHLRAKKISLAEFEDEIGWELQEFLQSPVKSVSESPILLIRDLSIAIGIHWLSLVPGDDDALEE